MDAVNRPRQIILLCDGTGKNGAHDSKQDEPTTNIWKLYNAIERVDNDYVEYFPGVGAENEKASTSDLLARTFGHTAVHSIKKIYLTIAREYQDGDCVSLFGYSRGAFIVRKVASLIGAIGLVTDEREFSKYWKSLEHKLPGRRNNARPTNPRRIPISCLGVWDTVGAVRPRIIREALNLLSLPDGDLPKLVESALHAVAWHENRKLFDATLFEGENAESSSCKQICFAGSHSDVGGGGEKERNILPEVTLDWMMRNMPALIKYRTLSLASEVPIDHPLLSSFHTSPAWKRIPDSHFRRNYLPGMERLHRHRTLDALASPESPHLLEHPWKNQEDEDLFEDARANAKPEEVPNVRPTKKRSVFRQFTDRIRSNTRMAPTPVNIPSLPIMPSIPSTTEPESLDRLDRPALHMRPYSESTQQTETTTDEPADSVSTPHTSVRSLDLEPPIPECADEPLPEPEPVPAVEKKEPTPVPIAEKPESIVEKPEAVVEKSEPVVEKPQPVVEQVAPEPVAATEPISEKPKPEAEKTTPTPVSNPRAKPKKGIIRRIKGFFRKTLCAGR